MLKEYRFITFMEYISFVERRFRFVEHRFRFAEHRLGLRNIALSWWNIGGLRLIFIWIKIIRWSIGGWSFNLWWPSKHLEWCWWLRCWLILRWNIRLWLTVNIFLVWWQIVWLVKRSIYWSCVLVNIIIREVK